MTSGVRVYNVPRLGVVNIPNPDKQLLAQSIVNLTLNPQDNNDTLGNNQAVQGNANNNDVGEEQVVNNDIGEETVNAQVMENVVGNQLHNDIDEEVMGGHFVDIGNDPVICLNLNGMSFLSLVFHYLFLSG